ncbi:MAG: hypothetical protein ACREOQ_17910 [Gemmatimonadales bacterium]
MQNVIHLECLLIVLGVALLPAGRTRSLAACAAIGSGLALAGLRAGPAQPVATLPPGFVAVEGALLVIGGLLALTSALAALRSARTPANVVGSAALAGGGLGVVLSGGRYLIAAPTGALLIAVIVIAGVGALLVAAGRLVRAAVPQDRPQSPPIALALIGGGALLAAVSSSTGGVFVGCMLAAIGGWLISRPSATRNLPVAPMVVLLLLLPAWRLMATIAGPEGLSIGALPDLPWSPAAERLLAPVLLLAAWVMSGLWPWHRQEPAALTAPVAALLVARVAIPAVPDGLDHWRALAFPLVMLGLWHGVLTRRRAESASGLAWVGLVTATPVGQAGGALVLLAGLALELAERLPARVKWAAPGVRAVATVVLSTGALLAIEGGLQTEVVYTVLAAAALVVGAGWQPSVQASTASAPTVTEPSA